VNTMRSAVYAGLVCLTPLVCWMLVELRATPLPVLAPTMLSALVSVQAVGIALWVPLLPPADAREQFLASILLALIPAPLGAILWLSGSVSLASLARVQLVLVTLALLATILSRILGHGTRFAPLLRGSLAVALTALLWQLRPHWLEPLLT